MYYMYYLSLFFIINDMITTVKYDVAALLDFMQKQSSHGIKQWQPFGTNHD